MTCVTFVESFAEWRTLQHQPVNVVEGDSVEASALGVAAEVVAVEEVAAGAVDVVARRVTRNGYLSPSWAVWSRT